MHRLLYVVIFTMLFSSGLGISRAQGLSPESAEVFRQLLSMPAPTPRSAETPTTTEPKKQRSPKFFDKDNVPPDGAPIDDLVEYWNRWADTSGRPDPSAVVQQRLLDACADDLETLPRFLPLFSTSETVAERVKELFDKGQSDQQFDENWRDKVKKWLVFNSKYFLSDLLALANKVKDDQKGGYVDKEEALVALARVDWSEAEPMLQSLASGSQPRTRALALTILYKQAIKSKDIDTEQKYRDLLRIIASDTNAPAHARDDAIEALSLSEWSGRDDWYLSLFQDETLIDPSDGIYGFSPLTTLFAKDPDKWIPVMPKLVKSKNPFVRTPATTYFTI